MAMNLRCWFKNITSLIADKNVNIFRKYAKLQKTWHRQCWKGQRKVYSVFLTSVYSSWNKKQLFIRVKFRLSYHPFRPLLKNRNTFQLNILKEWNDYYKHADTKLSFTLITLADLSNLTPPVQPRQAQPNSCIANYTTVLTAANSM